MGALAGETATRRKTMNIKAISFLTVFLVMLVFGACADSTVKSTKRLAEQGDARAQYNLGVMYDKGDGVEKDYREALKWYTKAAQQGDARAQNNLGVMYDNGDGVVQDYREALKWYTKAAQQGNAIAQNNLGLIYEKQGDAIPFYINDYGFVPDNREAHKWFNLAAAQGNENARTNRDRVAQKMTPAQIAEAQRLAREWQAD